MKKIIKKNYQEVTVNIDGFMAVGTENDLRTFDFVCCEDVEITPYVGKCQVQLMHDGNIYMTELPKRIKNKPIFREDNSSFSHGKDKKYYFYFSLDEDQLELLPEKLVRQASAIAQKVIRELIKGGNYRL